MGERAGNIKLDRGGGGGGGLILGRQFKAGRGWGWEAMLNWIGGGGRGGGDCYSGKIV